ncbi:MAG: hypothetical protein WC943_16340 [Elusimicrobiota bacterium]
MKFVNNATSILYLLRQTRIPELEACCLDIAGINVLTRAVLEAAFVFAYLFDLPKADSEREFRGDAWMLHDLLARQRFGCPIGQFKAQLEKERQKIEQLTARLRGNFCFASLSRNEQKAFMGGRKWRTMGWTQIGVEMGLDKNTASTFYSFLCSHAHAGYISVLQVYQAKTEDQRRPLVSIQSGMLAIATAHMIAMFVRAVPHSLMEFNKVPKDVEFVNMWKYIGAAKLLGD